MRLISPIMPTPKKRRARVSWLHCAPMTARSERQSQGHSDGVDGFLARAMGLQHALAGPSGGGADRAYAYGAKEMVQRFGLARLAEAVAKWSIRFSFCMPRKLGRHCVGCG